MEAKGRNRRWRHTASQNYLSRDGLVDWHELQRALIRRRQEQAAESRL